MEAQRVELRRRGFLNREWTRMDTKCCGGRMPYANLKIEPLKDSGLKASNEVARKLGVA
jgi:hypothetical protein